MTSNFSNGDRVQINALGATRCPRLANKTGTIVGRSSAYVNWARVLLDGTSYRHPFTATISTGFCRSMRS
jgi:hypothetical protein